MNKCNKVKHPCKICLGPVSKKNGVKCEGACGNWVHYYCLNHTPGKIKDIKQGIIKVCCPCPNCKTPFPKEYRVDEPFSCSNAHCPANMSPSCQSTSCPINSDRSVAALVPPPGAKCPLGRCGADCKQNSMPLQPPPMQQYAQDPSHPPIYELPSEMSCTGSCTSPSSGMRDVPGDFSSYTAIRGSSMPSSDAVEQMCNAVEKLSNKINELMMQMKNVNRENNSGNHQRTSSNQTNGTTHKPCFCPGNPLQGK